MKTHFLNSILMSMLLFAILPAPVTAELISAASLSIESNTLGERPMFAQDAMLDGSGVDPYDPSTLHDVRLGGTPSNWWLSSQFNTTGTIVVDLGGTHTINQFHLWNGSSTGGQNLNEIQIETSLSPTSGFTFTSLGSGLLDANTPGMYEQWDPIPAVTFSFDPVVASYFRLTIVSNTGSNDYTGIAEMAFSAVPEPSAFLLSLLSLGLIGGIRRRRIK